MTKVNIFLSYSHKDSRYFDEVRESLQTVEKEFGIDAWSDKNIPIGSKWKKEINKALENTDIGVFLVSRAFLNSTFINQVELPQLLARHNDGKTHIFIVILEDCTWDSREQLKEFQVFNEGIPLWSLIRRKRVKALKGLTEVIIERAKIIAEKNQIENDISSSLQDEHIILPFTNQVSIIESLSPPKGNNKNSFYIYAAITAPAGQGKSRLANRLKIKYLERGWDCGHLKLGSETSPEFFLNDSPVGIDFSLTAIHGNKNLGNEFFKKYKRMQKGKRKPLVIFIDTSDGVTKDDILSLDKNFIHDLDQDILTDKFLSRFGKYRLILTGRNLSSDLHDSPNFEKYKDLKLLPFRYEDVYEMISSMKDVFGDLDEGSKSDFVADILYLSGGHPGLMAKIIDKYIVEKKHHLGFINFYIKKYWNDDLRETMSEVSKGVFIKQKGIKEFAETTVALRYFNRTILESLFQQKTVEDIVSEIIAVSGLYSESRDEDYATLFSDGIIRNLHALYMLANKPKYIRAKCREAQKLCWDEISSGITVKAFMVEYLFQCFQESIAIYQNKVLSQRKSIRRKCNQKIDDFIKRLANIDRLKKRRGDYGRRLIGALKGHVDTVDSDKNKALFRFWVIYIYKDKSYNLDVYKKFVANIEKLVGKYFVRR